MKDTRLVVPVPSEFAEYIDAQVQAGPFRSAADFVVSLIRIDYLAAKTRERREQERPTNEEPSRSAPD